METVFLNTKLKNIYISTNAGFAFLQNNYILLTSQTAQKGRNSPFRGERCNKNFCFQLL